MTVKSVYISVPLCYRLVPQKFKIFKLKFKLKKGLTRLS